MRERPVAVFRPSVLGLLGTAILRGAVGVFAIGAITRYDVRGMPDETKAFFLHWLEIAVAAMVAFDLLVAFAIRSTTSLSVYPDRMTFSRGILSRQSSRVWTREIVGVDVKRPLIGRLLGYGTVVVDTRGADTLVIAKVADASRVMDILDEARAKDTGEDGEGGPESRTFARRTGDSPRKGAR